MILDSINMNHLRIFECVFRTKSMTLSAQELHLTQSGVSQHIKSLEDVLGVKLFDRIKQRLVPTPSATTLYEKCTQGLSTIEQALTEIKGGEKTFSGTVHIGIPIEFGNNVVLPILSAFGQKHKRVRFEFSYGYASKMNDLLLSGALDFAFVDEYALDRRIKIDPVYNEQLFLCSSKEYLKKRGFNKEDRSFFESLDIIDYMRGEPLVRMWFKHHFGKSNVDLNVRAILMDVQGIGRMILSGLGVGILPLHLVEKLEREGHTLVRLMGEAKPLKNKISVAYLPDRTQSITSLAVLEELRDHLKELAE